MPKPKDPLADTMYDMTSLNRLFFVSSLLLIGTIVWMMWQDYDRNWKNLQRSFRDVALEKARAEQAQADKEQLEKHGARLAELQKALDEEDKKIAAKQNRITEINEAREKDRGAREKALQVFQFAKSESDTLKQRAEHARDLAHAEEEASKGGGGSGKLESLKADAEKAKLKSDEGAAKTEETKLAWEKLEKIDRDRLKELETIHEEREKVSKEIAKLKLESETVKRKVEKLEPKLSDHALRMIGLDFIAPPEKIDQLILNHFQEDLNFTTVGKIDRCTTCHLGIDKKGYENEKNPVFRTHPNLELYVGDNSPHPMTKMGCTICHGGQGRSVDFYHAAHMPKNDKQGQEWKEKYGWKPVIHFTNPMTPMPYVEASCTKCHSSQVRVTGGEKVNEGKRLLESVGCFGCHPITGTEELRKPGPTLMSISQKVTKDWTFNWIRKPTEFRPTTKMPQAFDLSNTSDPDSLARNTAMIRGIVEYLFEESDRVEEGKPSKKPYPEPPAGDKAKGKELTEQVGCLACHVVGDPMDKGTAYTSFGPNLSSVGSKLNPGWTFAWLKDPKQYFAHSKMPNLRLSDAEAADITAYLLSLKHSGGFENKKMPDVKTEDLDRTILGFLKTAYLEEVAKEELAKLKTEKEKLLWLGKKAIGHMGCFGCHDIKGFETMKKIGAELTGSNSTGTKDISKFDFGFRHDLQKQHHPGSYDRIAWTDAKIKDPRTFDAGRIIPFEDRARMPLFNLTDEERDQILTYVLSFRREAIPLSHQRVLSPEEKIVERGRWLVDQQNCAGCHKIGNFVTREPLPVPPAPDADEDAFNQANAEFAAKKVFTARYILSDGRQVDRISEGELKILEKKGITVLYKPGTWLSQPSMVAKLARVPGMRFVYVFAAGEGSIESILNKNKGDNYAPPVVAGNGARTQPDWLFRFLKRPFEIRPWLTVRMPTFGFTDEQTNILVEHFALLAGEEFPYQDTEEMTSEARSKLVAQGEKVFIRMECGKCHPAGKDAVLTVSKGEQGPPFTNVAPRIQRDWFVRWIRDPKAIVPGTSMPSYPEDQISNEEVPALREYIWSLHGKNK